MRCKMKDACEAAMGPENIQITAIPIMNQSGRNKLWRVYLWN